MSDDKKTDAETWVNKTSARKLDKFKSKLGEAPSGKSVEPKEGITAEHVLVAKSEPKNYFKDPLPDIQGAENRNGSKIFASSNQTPGEILKNLRYGIATHFVDGQDAKELFTIEVPLSEDDLAKPEGTLAVIEDSLRPLLRESLYSADYDFSILSEGQQGSGGKPESILITSSNTYLIESIKENGLNNNGAVYHRDSETGVYERASGGPPHLSEDSKDRRKITVEEFEASLNR